MLDQVCQLARNAGDAIMQVYDGTKPMDVVSKADNSPVTAADIALTPLSWTVYVR